MKLCFERNNIDWNVVKSVGNDFLRSIWCAYPWCGYNVIKHYKICDRYT